MLGAERVGDGWLRGVVGAALALAIGLDLLATPGVPLGAIYAVPVALASWRLPGREVLLVGLAAVALNLLSNWLQRSFLPGSALDSLSLIMLCVGGVALARRRELLRLQRLDRERLMAQEQAARAEADLARQRVVTVLESIGDAVIATDAAGRVSFLNPVATALTGWPEAAAVGQPVEVVFHIVNEATRRPAEAPVARVLHDGTVVGLANHTLLLGRHGREIPIDDSAAPIRDSAGTLLGVVLVFRDVTERREAERVLRESESRYRTLVEQAADGIVVSDRGGRIIEANPQLCAMLGYTRDELRGRHLQNLVAPEDLAARPLRVNQLEVGKALLIERELLRRDGSRVPIEASTALLDDGRVQIIVRDITARRQAEVERARLYREAQSAVQARDEFLSVAAHELKTPITALRGYAQLVIRQLTRAGNADPERLRTAMTAFDEQSARLSRLVEQLLDVSRIEAGKLTLDRAPTDLVPMVRRVIESAEARTADHRLTLDAPVSVVANVDPLRLEQVLTNLIDNAVKFSPDGGPVEVSLSAAAGAVRLEVADRGLGVPAEWQGQIFERFFQAGAGQYGGMGLGLYISRQIVEQHGGTITLADRHDGGCLFVVCLPLTG